MVKRVVAMHIHSFIVEVLRVEYAEEPVSNKS